MYFKGPHYEVRLHVSTLFHPDEDKWGSIASDSRVFNTARVYLAASSMLPIGLGTGYGSHIAVGQGLHEGYNLVFLFIGQAQVADLCIHILANF